MKPYRGHIFRRMLIRTLLIAWWWPANAGAAPALPTASVPTSLAGPTTTPPDAPRKGAECVVPAKAGGGFDLTCKLAQRMLANERAVQLSYLPGGIGALAYTAVVTRSEEPHV